MKSTRRVLNFTSRIAIEMSRVQVIAAENESSGSIKVQKLDLSGYAIADGSPVVLEAITRRDGKIRVELGSTPEPDLSKELRVSPVFFNSARVRINVLDSTGTGRIVASIEDVDVLIPEASGVRSLLPTLEVESLVHRVWRLRVDSDGFCLEINKNFPLIGEVVRSPEFLGMVMPDVIRQIAVSILNDDCPVPEVTKKKWDQLFSSVYSDPQDLRSNEPDSWADEVSEALSGRHSLIIGLQNSWGEED